MIDREFIKKLNGLGALVTYEEEQVDINSNGDIVLKIAYKIGYRNPNRFYGKGFFNLVDINITDGYAKAYILKDITQMPISKTMEILKVVDEKVETVNNERKKQCETR